MNAKIYVFGIGNTSFMVQIMPYWNLNYFIFTKSLVAKINKSPKLVKLLEDFLKTKSQSLLPYKPKFTIK